MKGLLKFITCGSVDDGKSTLIGHILYDAKLLYTDQEKALELDSKVGSRGGAIDYSLLLDGLMAEREQGITIDVAYRYFTTDNRSFIVADTPGHEEYTRNMTASLYLPVHTRILDSRSYFFITASTSAVLMFSEPACPSGDVFAFFILFSFILTIPLSYPL